MPVKLTPVEEAILKLYDHPGGEWVEVSRDGDRPENGRDAVWWSLWRRGFEVRVLREPTLGLIPGDPNPSIKTMARWDRGA